MVKTKNLKLKTKKTKYKQKTANLKVKKKKLKPKSGNIFCCIGHKIENCKVFVGNT